MVEKKPTDTRELKGINIIKHIVSRPAFLNVMLILLQLLIYFEMYFVFAQFARGFTIFNYILSFVLIIIIINQDTNVAFKISWIVPLSAFPIFGAGLYLVMNVFPTSKKIRSKLAKEIKSSHRYMQKDIDESKNNISNLRQKDESYANLMSFLHCKMDFPTYVGDSCKYLDQGEIFFDSLKKDISKAKSFIFMEFFIISKGKLLDEIMEILEEKISQGVKVYMMYDGTNEFSLPKNFDKKLGLKGIKTAIFAPITPILSTYQNNRDHRKIVVIDGKIGYTGGVNLADEYAGYITRFGHWKDTGIRIEGKSVNSLSQMFMTMWNLSQSDFDKKLAYEDFLSKDNINLQINDHQSYITPFSDIPQDGENVSENVILHILYDAKKSINIITPYLIIDNELFYALSYAAKRGVEVNIIISGIPDKKIPYIVAESHFPSLINVGINIYKYTKGFSHAKSYTVDDKVTMIGTVNLDYRSLYLHFENAILVYDKNFSNKVNQDFSDTLLLCSKVSIEDYYSISVVRRFLGRILRIFSPLM